eukprot:maker-scaffold_5-snap-gene-5.60-mRNA-1 protein AED:0.20 eAED:0.20 QI:0/0.33/0.25/0.5/0.66/0.5/4/31/129
MNSRNIVSSIFIVILTVGVRDFEVVEHTLSSKIGIIFTNVNQRMLHKFSTFLKYLQSAQTSFITRYITRHRIKEGTWFQIEYLLELSLYSWSQRHSAAQERTFLKERSSKQENSGSTKYVKFNYILCHS